MATTASITQKAEEVVIAAHMILASAPGVTVTSTMGKSRTFTDAEVHEDPHHGTVIRFRYPMGSTVDMDPMKVAHIAPCYRDR